MLGEDNQADQARAMQQQMPGGASPQLMDEQKAFKAGFYFLDNFRTNSEEIIKEIQTKFVV